MKNVFTKILVAMMGMATLTFVGCGNESESTSTETTTETSVVVSGVDIVDPLTGYVYYEDITNVVVDDDFINIINYNGAGVMPANINNFWICDGPKIICDYDNGHVIVNTYGSYADMRSVEKITVSAERKVTIETDTDTISFNLD